MLHIVGIGEYLISKNSEDVLKTYALNSCVAITIYLPEAKILGMAHVVLPDSKINPKKSKLSPGYFADTAVAVLLDSLYGFAGFRSDLFIIHLFGGVRGSWEKDYFNVGRRNLAAIHSILNHRQLPYDSTETGGNWGRTVAMDVATGTAIITKTPIF